MPVFRSASLAGALLLAAAAFAPAPAARAQQPTYPQTRRGSVVEDYHGTRIADPYRWLESLESPETKAWTVEQSELTARYLAAIPERERIRERLTALWNYARQSVPYAEAGRLWYSRNDGLQKQSPLYSRDEAGAERLELDPNVLSPDGATAIVGTTPSPDGRYLIVGLSEGGADFRDAAVLDRQTGAFLPDTVRWIKFSPTSWTKDGKGFFYARYPEPEADARISEDNRNHRVYYHVVGTPVERDRLVYEDPSRPGWINNAVVSDDGRWLLLTSTPDGSRNELRVADLGDAARPNVAAPLVPVVPEANADYLPVGSRGDSLVILTNRDAANWRVVVVPVSAPDPAKWRTVVPEGESVITAVVAAGGQLVVQRQVDALSRLETWAFAGTRTGEIAVPGPGTVSGLNGHADAPVLFYGFTSYLVPGITFRHDLRAGTSEVFFETKTSFDASPYESRQVFYTSKDGTRVPMIITARRDLPRDGRNSTVLFAYGGFNISVTPAFSPRIAAWLDLGGVYAVPNLRGGSEYGEAWHEAGMRDRKQNVFDDFIAAAEYLQREGITSPDKLALSGGSNGGLLVGATMVQRPDLAAVALPGVGVLDMLRFDEFSAGKFWVSEYGSAKDPEAFRWLRAYSPLHNVKPGVCYPATMAYTADHDDRVVPSHTYKFTATVQAVQQAVPGCRRPVLARIQLQGSHGYRPTDQQIAEVADLWTFTADQLGMAVRP